MKKLIKHSNKKRQTVCVIGLGYVGSATSIAISISKTNSNYNFDVIGLEKNNSKGKNIVNNFNKGKFPYKNIDNSLTLSLKKQLKINLKATVDKKYLSKADYIVCNINLDIKKSNNDISLKFEEFKKSISEIGKIINPNSLLIIETTVPPGTCKKIVAPIIEKEFKNRGFKNKHILLAHSYERVMPGEKKIIGESILVLIKSLR